MAEAVSSEFLLGFQTFCAGAKVRSIPVDGRKRVSDHDQFTLVHTVSQKCNGDLVDSLKSLGAGLREDHVLSAPSNEESKRDFQVGRLVESQGLKDDHGHADPPHREIIARFQRLKSIRHPHLCAYTNILRNRDRIFVVSEHWSLSLEDIIRKWREEDASTECIENPDECCALRTRGKDSESRIRQQPDETERRGFTVSYLKSIFVNPSFCVNGQKQHRRGFIERVVAQVLTALEYLNSLGMCHNRIEPRTIRIDAQGDVKLSEWGLWFLTKNGILSPLTSVACSFLHLAPEQVLVGSEPLKYSSTCAKQDVWALGIVLLQLVSPCGLKDVSLRVAAHLNASAEEMECELASNYPGIGTEGIEDSDSANEGDGCVGNSDVAILHETLEKVSQLVFYCWLGIRYRLVHSLELVVQQKEQNVDELPVSTHLSLIGSDTYKDVIMHLPLLELMMKCAVAFPCYMVDANALRSVIKGYLHATPVIEGVPSTNEKTLFKRVESALLKTHLKRFAEWISGTEIVQLLKPEANGPERAHFTESGSDMGGCLYNERITNNCSASVYSTPSSFANIVPPQRNCDQQTTKSGFSKDWVEDLIYLLRSCLSVFPAQRATASDLLGYKFVQRHLERKTLWVPREANCVNVVTELRADEELRRIRTNAVEGVSDMGTCIWLCRIESTLICFPGLMMGAIQLALLSALLCTGECKGSALQPAVGSHLGILMLHHNTSVDEIFYWWQLQGGDIFAELQKSGAFSPIPPIFEVPICMVRPKRSSRLPSQAVAPNCSCSGGGYCEHDFSSIPFLVALSDSLIHTATTANSRCSCLSASLRISRPTLSVEHLSGKTPEHISINKNASVLDQYCSRNCSGQNMVGCDVNAGGAVEKPLASTKYEESFFLTGFQKGRDWRHVHLWNVGDARVFGVSIEETVRAIEEADKFPVAQMLEVRPTCVYRRQCHFLYQRLRVRMFKSLLAQLPKSRPRLFEEAASDIPPLLRSDIWCVLLGVSTAEVRDPDIILPCECEHNAKVLQGLHHEEFSKFHEVVMLQRKIKTCVIFPSLYNYAALQYDDLLGSQEGRLRLQRILHRARKANPFYMCARGLDALGAPFLSLNFNREWIAFCCLNQFLRTFQKHLFENDNKNALKNQMQISEKLLMFVDAELALHLQSLGLHFDLYAVSWHLTLFSHALPLPQLLLLWDSVLVQPPSFIHFLTVCILHLLRVPLLGFGNDEDSSAIKLINASFDFVNIPLLCATANALQNATPWTITLHQQNKPISSSCLKCPEAVEEKGKDAAYMAFEKSDLGSPVRRESFTSDAQIHNKPNTTHLQDDRVTNIKSRGYVFYFGANDESPGTSVGSPPSRSNSSCEFSRTNGSLTTQTESWVKRRSSWRARTFVDVMKTPAMLLMGAPRKPLVANKNANISEDESVDPLDSLYEDSPGGRRWWEDMSEASFLQMSKPCWNQVADVRSHCQGHATHSPSGIHLHPSGVRTPEPPCVGIDVLLHFHEESLILDIRSRLKFLSEHFIDAINVRPRDIPDLLSLFTEQRHAHDTSKVVANILKKGGLRPSGGPRALSGKSTGKFYASVATKESVDTPFISKAGFDSVDNDIPLQGVTVQRSVKKVSASEPWINVAMGKMSLVVIIGDRHDSGAGLARHLQVEGVSGVCILLGGFDAIKQDAPSHYLVSKR